MNEHVVRWAFHQADLKVAQAVALALEGRTSSARWTNVVAASSWNVRAAREAML